MKVQRAPALAAVGSARLFSTLYLTGTNVSDLFHEALEAFEAKDRDGVFNLTEK